MPRRIQWRCPACDAEQDGPIHVTLRGGCAWLQCAKPDCRVYSRHMRYVEGWRWAGVMCSHLDEVQRLEAGNAD